MNLYLTADRVGIQTGGGIVTRNEWEAFQSLGEATLLSADQLNPDPDNRTASAYDQAAYYKFGSKVKLAHAYSGTFTDSITKLKSYGAKVTYTAAAHSIQISREEHERLGLQYDYPHLTDPLLWKFYVKGYQMADVVIVPSRHSKEIMEGYGCKDIEIIPHGVDLPVMESAQPPSRFTVGYLGAVGADKGLIYLLSAWKLLNYKDATLVLAGSQSINPFVQSLVRATGASNVHLAGWVNDLRDFYGRISLYCQPSASEGFGIEVLEAMAHFCPVISSLGAGASDLLLPEYTFPSRNVEALADLIAAFRAKKDKNEAMERNARVASEHSWDHIKERYLAVWKKLI